MNSNRVAAWLRKQQAPQLATCAITELGFLRVLAQAPAYGLTVAQARTLLVRMKQSGPPSFTFIRDDHGVSHLPAWVKFPKQITDGHLVKLASANEAVLATLDARIPAAYVIPEKWS